MAVSNLNELKPRSSYWLMASGRAGSEAERLLSPVLVALHLSALLSSVLALPTVRLSPGLAAPCLCSAQLPQLSSPNCSSQNPKSDSYWLELGHVPILKPIVRVKLLLGPGSQVCPRFWDQVSLTQQCELGPPQWPSS